MRAAGAIADILDANPDDQTAFILDLIGAAERIKDEARNCKALSDHLDRHNQEKQQAVVRAPNEKSKSHRTLPILKQQRTRSSSPHFRK